MSSYNIFDVAKDALTGNIHHVTLEEKKRRLLICEGCPERNALLNTCKICHCWLPGKASHRDSSCPKGKW